MIVYILACLFSITISKLIEATIGYEKNTTLKVFVALLPLTLVSIFRYDVGWDYIKIYTNGFYYVGKYNLAWFTEKGFLLIIKLLYTVFGNPISLFVLFGILTSYFFALCCKQYVNNYKYMHIFILMFFITRTYFMSLNIIRQSLAILIILYALHYIKEKKFLKYLIFILLAFEIHFTSIVYLPLYFVLNKRLNNKKNILLLLLLVPCLFGTLFIFAMKTKYINYFTSMFGNDGGIVFSELLIATIVLLIRNFLVNKNARWNNMDTIFFNTNLISFTISLMTFILPLGDRMIWYFSMTNIFYIPYLIKNIDNRNIRFVAGITIISCLLLVCILQTFWKDSYSILPYQTIFNNSK